MKPLRIARSVFTAGWTGVVSTYAVARQALRPDPRAMARSERGWAHVLLRAWGVEVETHGLEKLPLGTRSVLLPNHESYIDVVALFAVLPELPVFLAKKELGRIPLFGRAMVSGGHIFVDRKDRSRALEAMAEAAASLKAGSPLVIFPEGTRRRGPTLGPFKRGAFHLAKSARVPLVPIGIRGSLAAWPTGAAAPDGGRVSIHVGDPVPAEHVAETDVDTLIAELRAEIGRLADLPLG